MARDLRAPGRQSVGILLIAVFLVLGISACGGAAIDTGPSTTPARSNVPLPTGAYRLQAGGKTIVESGNRIPIKPKSVTGYVDHAILEGKLLVLSGWAPSADLSRSAKAVVAFVGKEAVAATEPMGERPDVAEGYNKPGLERSGFLLSIPVSSLDCPAPQQGLTIVEITGGKATPLVWLADTRQHVDNACGGNNASP